MLARSVGAAPGALMRGHGAVVAGSFLPQVVARSIYMEVNARIQLDALRLGGPVRYLDPEEARLTVEMHGDYPRAWEMWKRSVSAAPATRRSR
jgi:HCOMODA/2-hydroxy-3-carboxy-muconic semialdehyde decarboxylase